MFDRDVARKSDEPEGAIRVTSDKFHLSPRPVGFFANFAGFSFEVIACIVRYGKSKSDLPPAPQI
jgi:hypothetical protein